MTRLTEELGLSLDRVKNIKIEALKRIPEPPDLYQKWRCLIRGDEENAEQLSKGRRTLRRESKDEEAIQKVLEYEKDLVRILRHNLQWAEMALAIDKVEFEGMGMAPVEKVEIRENDKSKPGTTGWMLISGFEFWMDGEKRKWRKVYMPLHPEDPKFDLLRALKGEEKREPVLMPGSGERGYPMEWDVMENKVDDF